MRRRQRAAPRHARRARGRRAQPRDVDAHRRPPSSTRSPRSWPRPTAGTAASSPARAGTRSPTRCSPSCPCCRSYRRAVRPVGARSADLPRRIRAHRLDQMGTLLIGTIAGWEWRRQRGEPRARRSTTCSAELDRHHRRRPDRPRHHPNGAPDDHDARPPPTSPVSPPRTVRAARASPRRTPDGWVDEPYTRFTLRPSHPTIGAEIGGIDLAEPLDDDTFAELHRALLEWKVLFFRDAGPHAEPAPRPRPRAGATLERHPFIKHTLADQPTSARGRPLREGRRRRRLREHLAQRRHLARGAVARLAAARHRGARGRRRHAVGRHGARPTTASTTTLKARIDGLTAVHDWWYTLRRAAWRPSSATRCARLPAGRAPRRAHPPRDRPQDAVRQRRLHPAHRRAWTATRATRCSSCCTARPTYPEYQCRFRWTPGAIAFWDNRATQHYATSDYFPQRRVMERITVVGDRPR